MKRLRPAALAAACLALGAAQAAAADLHMVQKITMGGQSMDMEVWMSGRRVRMAVGSPMGRVGTIVDVPAGKVITMMEASKSYTETSLDALMGAAKAAGGQLPSGEVTVSKTGKTQVINGWSCAEYRITQPGAVDASVWATRDIKVDIRDWMAFGKEFQQSDPLSRAFDPAKIDGFPVRTEGKITQGGQQVEFRSEVTKVDAGPVPADAFTLPSDFKKLDLGNPFGTPR